MHIAPAFRARLFLVIAALATILTVVPNVACAQAPPPVGNWSTTPPTERLVVYANGTCGFFFNGQVRVSGRCTWNPTSRGGILDITYPMPLEPGHVRYSIVWVNRTTITVFGDVFHKR
jgi:hypothetical protein